MQEFADSLVQDSPVPRRRTILFVGLFVAIVVIGAVYSLVAVSNPDLSKLSGKVDFYPRDDKLRGQFYNGTGHHLEHLDLQINMDAPVEAAPRHVRRLYTVENDKPEDSQFKRVLRIHGPFPPFTTKEFSVTVGSGVVPIQGAAEQYSVAGLKIETRHTKYSLGLTNWTIVGAG